MQWTFFDPLNPILAREGVCLVENPQEADVLVAKFWRRRSVLKYHWLYGARRFLAWHSECNMLNATTEPRQQWFGLPPIDVMLPENGSIFSEIGATFGWSCLRDPNEIQVASKGKLPKVVCMLGRKGLITSNSMCLRPDGNDLRGIRLHLAEQLHANGIGDIYGEGWPEAIRIEDSRNGQKGDWHRAKLPVCDSYDFTMAIENTLCRNYVTEKIWDAIQSDSVPLYYGNPWIYEVFPKNSFLDIADFSCAKDLIAKLRSMSFEEKVARKEKCLAVYARFVEEALFQQADEALARRTAERLRKMCGEGAKHTG